MTFLKTITIAASAVVLTAGIAVAGSYEDLCMMVRLGARFVVFHLSWPAGV